MKKYFLSIVCTIFLTTLLTPAIAQSDEGKSAIMLNHIAVHVNDLGKSGEFYGKVLQLKEIPEPFNDGLHLWYSVSPTSQLHLIQSDEAAIVSGKTSHLCFSVPSIEDFISNLDKFSIDYSDWQGNPTSITTRTDGVKQIYFQDPDGYWIEVNNDFQ